MSQIVYELAIAPLLQSLKSLDGIINKAEAYLAANEDVDEQTLVQARLYPNMRPFVFQIRVATDTAKGAAARLSGSDLPSWPDDETTLADLHSRIAKAVDFLSGFDPTDFAGAESRAIELILPKRRLNFTGSEYISRFVLPNFYFHMTTAYAILRHNGVALGKPDFLGSI